MNKSVTLGLIVASIAASSLITYQVVQSKNVELSGQYVKKEELKDHIDKYLDQNANSVFAAVVKGVELRKQAEAEKQRQAVLASKEALENEPGSPYFGNENADINIVMFSDYQCGYCKKSAPVMHKLIEEDENLKVIVKEYPILGPGSIISAKAALAAYNLDKTKYAAFNRLLFENPLNSKADLIEVAKTTGLDANVLLTEMTKPEYDKTIQKNQVLGSSLGVNGTPAFIIDGVLYPGAMPEEQIVEVIKSVREKRMTKQSKI